MPGNAPSWLWNNLILPVRGRNPAGLFPGAEESCAQVTWTLFWEKGHELYFSCQYALVVLD